MLSCHLYEGVLSSLVPSVCPTKTLQAFPLSPTRTTFPPYLILLHFVWSTQHEASQNANFHLSSPLTSSLLGPNTFLSIRFCNIDILKDSVVPLLVLRSYFPPDHLYRGADKSLARPGRKQATATEDIDVHFFFSWRYNPQWGLYFTAL